MFGFIANSIGKVLGEAATQTGNLWDDICSIPEEIKKGYEEEIFAKTPPKETPVTPTEPTDK